MSDSIHPETVGINRGDGRRPYAILVFPFSNRKCLCWDATCVDTFAETHINSSAVTPGAADNAAEDGKRHKYAAQTVQFRFEPWMLETAGVLGKTTEVLLKEMGRLQAIAEKLIG